MSHPDGSDQSVQEPQEAAVENRESAAAAEQQQESLAGSGEEGKGVKRKREEVQSENETEGSSKQVTGLKWICFAFSIERHGATRIKCKKKQTKKNFLSASHAVFSPSLRPTRTPWPPCWRILSPAPPTRTTARLYQTSRKYSPSWTD